MNTINVGLVGAGGFLTRSFLRVFMNHPSVGKIYIADRKLERAEKLVAEHNLAGAVGSLDELLEFDIDAVGVFTSRHTHAPLMKQAMESGRHVYSAVPAAVEIEQLHDLVELSGRRRLVCMMGETSYYYPEAVFCREEYASGRWGKFVHADAQYVHDMATWGPHFRATHGDDWRRFASIPPMFYATHSFSLPLSITGASVTSISAEGYRDPWPEDGFAPGANEWDNPFSNQVALTRTSDGGTLRIGEFRRLGWFARRPGREVMMPAFYCTDACFEENSVSSTLTYRSGREGGLDWVHTDVDSIDVDEWVSGPYFEDTTAENASRHLGLAPAHHPTRLPDKLKGVKNGHNGAHHFLIDDFVRSCVEGALPPCHIWDAAAWCAPGLIAHQSALRDGETLKVPDFGRPPADWAPLRYPERPVDPRRPSLPPLVRPTA